LRYLSHLISWARDAASTQPVASLSSRFPRCFDFSPRGTGFFAGVIYTHVCAD
jgi:hypothetical protein